MNAMRLNRSEQSAVQKALKLYGYDLDGGSVEILDSGKTRAYISLDIHGAATIGSTVGQRIRNILNVDEILINGCKA